MTTLSLLARLLGGLPAALPGLLPGRLLLLPPLLPLPLLRRQELRTHHVALRLLRQQAGLVQQHLQLGVRHVEPRPLQPAADFLEFAPAAGGVLHDLDQFRLHPSAVLGSQVHRPVLALLLLRPLQLEEVHAQVVLRGTGVLQRQGELHPGSGGTVAGDVDGEFGVEGGVEAGGEGVVGEEEGVQGGVEGTGVVEVEGEGRELGVLEEQVGDFPRIPAPLVGLQHQLAGAVLEGRQGLRLHRQQQPLREVVAHPERAHLFMVRPAPTSSDPHIKLPISTNSPCWVLSSWQLETYCLSLAVLLLLLLFRIGFPKAAGGWRVVVCAVSIIKMQSLELKELLRQTELIQDELATLRTDLTLPPHPSPHSHTLPPSHYLERAVALRVAFRAMAEGIEGKRGVAQLQKERIEKSKIFLEGLQYYKSTLQAKIRESEIEVVDLQEYLEQPLQVADWVEDFPAAQAALQAELEAKKRKKSQFEQMQADKARRQVETSQKRELYEKVLPQHALRLYEQVAETGRLFNIVEAETAPPLKHPALASLFDRLSPLRSSKLLELTVSCDQFEEIEVVVLPADHAYYRQAQANKLPLVEREFKWSVASLGVHFDQLVVGVHRREDFSNEELFQRLVAGQCVQEVFPAPANEFERNINAKYVRAEWLQTLLIPGILSPHALLALLRERLFCLQLTALLLEQSKKIGFFFPLTGAGENPPPLNLKKSAVGSLEKIKFGEYVELVQAPSWVGKYLNSCNLAEAERKSGNLQAQLRGGADRLLLQEMLRVYKLQELAEDQLSNYYRGSFSLAQTSISFVLLVPYSYPKTPSHIRVLQITARKEEEPRAANLPLPCKLKLQPRRPFSDRCLAIERAVNEDIGEFLKGGAANPFRMLLQLNRLLSLFAA